MFFFTARLCRGGHTNIYEGKKERRKEGIDRERGQIYIYIYIDVEREGDIYIYIYAVMLLTGPRLGVFNSY